MQAARAPGTVALYNSKWKVYVEWCVARGVSPYCASVAQIANFLDHKRSAGSLAYDTIKGYLAAISAFVPRVDNSTVYSHPRLVSFLKGVKNLRGVRNERSASWDLPLVLNALCSHPFEPLETVDLKWLSAKIALLLALVSLGRVSELCALSTEGIHFNPDNSKVMVYPNPSFRPKHVTTRYRRVPLVLTAFHLSPSSEEERRLHFLCPVRALRIYLDRTAPFRQTTQVLVCHGGTAGKKGAALSAQRLSHWICEGIARAYVEAGHEIPKFKAHSTRGVAASTALYGGVSMESIMSTAMWSSPHTFISHYLTDQSALTVANAVLGTARRADA